MQTSDFGAFGEILDQLCATWDRPPARDELRNAYWSALQDVSLREMRANAERLMRTATGKQPFPKPAELRNESPRESTPAADATLAAAEARCVRGLEELRVQNPFEWRREVVVRKLNRVLATAEAGSPLYERALEDLRQLEIR